MQTIKKKGSLYLLGTPIGNYNDITLNVLKFLKSVQLILCEDSRETSLLLDNFFIKKPLLISYVGSKTYAYKKSYELLTQNIDVALVADRGMPCISDPGAEFVHYYRSLGVPIRCLSGVSSVTMAFSLSGLNGGFHFHGFLPKKFGDLYKTLNFLLSLNTNIIFFESSNRIKATLSALQTLIFDQKIFIFRELTKTYEEILFDSIQILLLQNLKGELVVIIPKK